MKDELEEAIRFLTIANNNGINCVNGHPYCPERTCKNCKIIKKLLQAAQAYVDKKGN